MNSLFDRLAVCRGKTGTILWTALICVMVFARTGAGAPVSIDTATEVARNLISHLNAPRDISSAEPVQRSGQKAGYLFHLAPRGYVLVAEDDVRVPVKGYSLNSNFSDLPPAYVDNLLKELEVPDTPTRRIFSNQADGINASYWDFLLTPQRRLTVQAYTPDTFLLTTRWGQNYPYNKLNPTVGDDLTLTGCVQTAVAQIMRYHAHPETGSGVFTHDWNSQDLTAVINRPFNWGEMPDKVDGSAPEYQQDEVAALMRDLGILNQATFGTGSTSASFRYWYFERAFGYADVFWMDMGDSDLFFDTLKDEIDAERPVLFTMPGHMMVADGYASDGAGRKIHLNLGWGGYSDSYYFLDQTEDPYAYDSSNDMYYNIRPCVGGECNPYDPTGGGQAPVIASPLEDMIIDTETTIRLDAYDPDGDQVTLSASSSCDSLQVTLTNNLLTLTPIGTDFFCRVLVQARSQDGAVSSTFDVLCLDEKIYLGDHFDIGGQFVDQYEVDEYTAYLEGDVTISGTRGYSNQAFYIWVENQAGTTVLGPDNDTISGNLAAGTYKIAASLASGLSYYPYDEDTSGYILTVTAGDTAYTVSNHAGSLGIDLSACLLHVDKIGSGNGTVTSSPVGIDCGQDCDEAYNCGTEVILTAVPDDSSMFTGWSGDCAGTSVSTTVTINSENSCTATFEKDVDQDGMPDDWEDANGLDSTINDADGDKDGDGVPNVDEYWAGTNPNSLPSMPWINLLLLDE